MAEETVDINTAEDPVEEQQRHEHQASTPEAFEEPDDGSGQEKSEQPAAESSWSGPILSLARKATETISSGMSYAAAPRKSPHGSAATSPTEKEPENDLSSNSKKLPGRLRLFPDLFEHSDYATLFLLSFQH